MPYRGGGDSEPLAPARTGLVADVVRQFTDPLAFYRELVQNAIDAGATSIRVHVLLEGPSQSSELPIARISVADDGEGMTAETIEERLVVLFRSSKAAGAGKIGKFGIGFVSVLAIEPERVTVDSARDGRGHLLHLYADHSYELFDRGPADASGTTITLRVPTRRAEFRDLVARSERALRRFCEHIEVPLTFSAFDDAPITETRIDSPFAIDDALVTVTAAHEGGRIALGLANAAGVTRFYNRGLLLHESAEPLVFGLVAKLEDRALGHTLSRDDVRKDAAYDALLRRTREVASIDLPHAIARKLATLCAADDGGAIREILGAIETLRLEVAPSTIRIPELIEGGLRSASLAELTSSRFGSMPLYYALQRTRLVDAALRAGLRVAWLGSMSTAPLGLLARVGGTECIDVHARFSYVEPVEHQGSDALLLDECEALFDHALRAPSQIVLGGSIGASTGRSTIATPIEDGQLQRFFALSAIDPFRLLDRPALVLDVAHPTVEAARKAAQSDPVFAASLLVRAVLLSYGELSQRVDERLTTRVLGLQLRRTL